jgi:uridine phosphorylase
MEFHIKCDPEEIARYVFVPGDHERAKRIADHFDDSHLVTDTRGYYVYTGTVDGIQMTAVSTGMGGPQIAIGIEELANMGADTFIRVGSCGTLQDHVDVGDLVIPTGVYRAGATADAYLSPAFPAAPTWQMLDTLVAAAQDFGVDVHVGVGWSGDAFYAPFDPGLGWRAGAIFACDGTSKETKPAWGEEAFRRGEAQEILIAIEAMKRVALSDRASG